MTDNRTTELLKDYVFTLRRLEYDVDKPGSNMTLGEYEAEEKRVTDEYAQAIAATLGNARAERTCKFVSSKGSDYPPVCSACGYELGIYDCEWFEDGTYGYDGNYCPNCGAKAVKR